MMDDYLEEDYKPAYSAWQLDPTPEGNATMLKTINPIVQKGIKMYGGDSPLSASRGRSLALEALRKYDPKRSRLQSHVLNHMQGLRRSNRQQQQIINVPERILQESQKLRDYSQEFTDELGREPSDSELSDKLGVSAERLASIRRYQPGMSTGQGNALSPEGGGDASVLPNSHDAQDMWVRVVHQDLGVLDQQIMEHTLGLNGRPKLSNKELAKRLNRSPGAISQRKIKIQRLLDQEMELSPFIAE